MNTHIGLVGAYANGKPVIYHNVGYEVLATPYDALSTSKLMIAWYKKPNVSWFKSLF